MKKVFLGLAVAISSLYFAQQTNGLEIGVFGGIPVSNVSKYYSASSGVNLAYTHSVSEQLSLGVATGWGHYFENKKIPSTGLNYFPLAIKGKYTLGKVPASFSLDIGTALYSSKNVGFYTFPKVAYSIGKHEVYLGYQYLATNKKIVEFNSSQYEIKVNNAGYGSISVGYNFIIK